MLTNRNIRVLIRTDRAVGWVLYMLTVQKVTFGTKRAGVSVRKGEQACCFLSTLVLDGVKIGSIFALWQTIR